MFRFTIWHCWFESDQKFCVSFSCLKTSWCNSTTRLRQSAFVWFIKIDFKLVKTIGTTICNVYIFMKNMNIFMLKHIYMLLHIFMLLHILILLHIFSLLHIFMLFPATSKECPHCCVLINRKGVASPAWNNSGCFKRQCLHQTTSWSADAWHWLKYRFCLRDFAFSESEKTIACLFKQRYL